MTSNSIGVKQATIDSLETDKSIRKEVQANRCNLPISDTVKSGKYNNNQQYR
jgi:hypothetical protein